MAEGRSEEKVDKISPWKEDSRRSWAVLFLSVMPINILLGMDTTAFGVYYVEYMEYFQDASSGSIGLISSSKMALMFFCGVVTSTLLHKFGCRNMAVAGGAINFAAMFLASFASNVLLLILTQGVLLGIGSNLINLTTNYLSQRLFARHRALGGGFCMLFFTIGNMIGPLVTDVFITMYGWRGSLMIQAALTTNMIAFGLIMPGPEQPTTKPDEPVAAVDKDSSPDDDEKVDVETAMVVVQRGDTCSKKCSRSLKEIFDFALFRRVVFTLAIVDAMADRFNLNLVRQHIPNRAVYLGMSRSDGATFLAANGIAVLVTRILVMFIANVRSDLSIAIYTSGTLLGALSSFLIVVFHSYIGQLTMSIVDGIHGGMTNTLYVVMLVDIVGIHHLPRALALYGIMVGVSMMTAAPLGGFIYDQTSNYDIPFILAACVALVGGIHGIVATILHFNRCRRKIVS